MNRLGRYSSGPSWHDNMMDAFTSDGLRVIDGGAAPAIEVPKPSWEDYMHASFTPEGLRITGLSVQGILVGFVSDTQTTLPTTRIDGSPLQVEDHVRPTSTSEFPFTVTNVGGDTITISDIHDQLFWTGQEWSLNPGVLPMTKEVPVTDKANESYSGTAINQKEINVNATNTLKNHNSRLNWLEAEMPTKVTKYEVMPVPTADMLGKIAQYHGDTTALYIQGYFYKVVALGTDPETYGWSQLDVEPETAWGEITGNINNQTDLQNEFSVEATARANADTQLQNNINTVSTNLATEIQDRTNADAILDGNITALANGLTAETTARTNADTALQSDIDAVEADLATEITNRTNADSALQTAINAKQNISNLVTSVSASSTDTQYPSAKLLYDTVGNVETLLTTLISGGGAQ